jgi:hypothetical protein
LVAVSDRNAVIAATLVLILAMLWLSLGLANFWGTYRITGTTVRHHALGRTAPNLSSAYP